MNLSNINVTIKELEDMRMNQDLSWDEIAIRVGKARNTIKKTILKEYGEEVWKALSKKEPVILSEPEQEKLEKKEKLNIGSKSEPVVKHFISDLEDGSVNITVFIDDKKLSKTFKSPVMTLKVIDAIKAKDVTSLETYLSMTETISKAGITFDEVANKYNINGVVLDSACRELIMKCYNDTINGHHDSITGLTAMVHDLNKSKKLHLLSQLYGFLKHNDVEILSDGSFICYKYLTKTDSGYVDHYSKSIKQRVGDYVYTFEELVNKDPTVTCSYGLHVATWDYVKGSTTVAKVRVLPEDVVSIPVDYDGSKMRCKGYTILEIKDKTPTLNSFTDSPLLDISIKGNVFVQATK